MTKPLFSSQGDDSSRKDLLPGDPLGQHFLKYFNHGWRFILAQTPEEGERVQWRTETRYPLEPRDLWELHQDPEYLLGLSFGSYTMFIAADIDSKSKNHPNRSRRRFDGVLEAMEGIGLCRPIILQSSDSGGLHIYWFLPQAAHSFSLAIAAKRALNKADIHFRLIDGQLELFPNPKAYDLEKVRNFRPLRLPLQAGSYLLDRNLERVNDSVHTLVHWADWSANGQDLETLEVAMGEAVEWHKKELRFRRRRNSIEQFRADLQNQIQTGWESYGQTNFLLWKFAMYGIIFEGLEGEELVKWMIETATKARGYERFCRHQHEIEKRVKDWAKCAQQYYYPYPGQPPRDKSFKEIRGDDLNNKSKEPYAASKQRRREVIEQVKEVVGGLRAKGEYPVQVKKRIKAMIAKSQEKYEKGFSQATLYQDEYEYLWHPRYDYLYGENGGGVNPDYCDCKYPPTPDYWYEEDKKLKVAEERKIEGLQVKDITEGFLLASAKGENGNTRAGEQALACGEAQRPEQGSGHSKASHSEDEGKLIPREVNNFNPSLDLILLSLIAQIFSNSFNSINANNNSTSSNLNGSAALFNLINSNNSIPSNPVQINSDSINPVNSMGSIEFLLNLLVELTSQLTGTNEFNLLLAESRNNLEPLLDKLRLYWGYAEARSKNSHFSPKSHKQNLSILNNLESMESPQGSSKPAEANPTTPKPFETGSSACAGISSNGKKPTPYGLNSRQFLDRWQKLVKLAVGTDEPSEDKLQELSEQERISLAHRQGIKLKLQAIKEAKHLVLVFCKAKGVRLASGLRELLEQLLKHSLYQRCPSPLLQTEAGEWFETHQEEIKSEVDGLDIFWDYFADLVF